MIASTNRSSEHAPQPEADAPEDAADLANPDDARPLVEPIAFVETNVSPANRMSATTSDGLDLVIIDYLKARHAELYARLRSAVSSMRRRR